MNISSFSYNNPLYIFTRHFTEMSFTFLNKMHLSSDMKKNNRPDVNFLLYYTKNLHGVKRNHPY